MILIEIFIPIKKKYKTVFLISGNEATASGVSKCRACRSSFDSEVKKMIKENSRNAETKYWSFTWDTKVNQRKLPPDQKDCFYPLCLCNSRHV